MHRTTHPLAWTRWTRGAAWLLHFVGALAVVLLVKVVVASHPAAQAQHGPSAPTVASSAGDEAAGDSGAGASDLSDDEQGEDDSIEGVVAARVLLPTEARDRAPDLVNPLQARLRGLAPKDVSVPPPRA